MHKQKFKKDRFSEINKIPQLLLASIFENVYLFHLVKTTL